MDPERFVFLDETGATTNMTRRYGCGPRSERLVDATPWGHWRTTTFVAGLRATGLVAPWLLGSAMDGPAVRTYGRAGARPRVATGRRRGPGQSARTQGDRRARRDPGGGSQPSLPAPVLAGLNPIEQVFAKFKALLRQ